MFGKKCIKCKKEISRKFEFCPYCGLNLKKEEDYGLLGKDDNLEESFFSNPLSKNQGLFSGSGSIVEKMLGNAFNMLEKEIKNIDRQERMLEGIPGNFQLFINGKRITLPGQEKNNIKKLNPENQENKRLTFEEKEKNMEKHTELIKKSAKLPRKEAKSKLSRIGNKVIYELETPGLKEINNVLVTKLENSIEIKAFTDKAVYIKTLPGKLPLVKYSLLSNDNLVLEFGN